MISIEKVNLVIAEKPLDFREVLERRLFSRIKLKSQTKNLLTDINIQLSDGDIVGLVGPNGCGKTTLLRVLSGIYEPTTGRVKIQGGTRSLLNLTWCLYEDLTGYENIEVIARNYGIYDKVIFESLTRDVESFSELGIYLSRPVRTYSEGMRLRLAFAVATYGKTDNLFIDEVVSVGDRAFVKKAEQRFLNIAKSSKISVISTHNESIINDWCNVKIEMNQGRIVNYEKMY